MREVLMALGSCALIVYLLPTVLALALLAWAAFRFWRGGGR